MCSVWIWEQTTIISLYNINWLVFITETECVYCAVRSIFYVLPTHCIYVFCVDLRTDSDYFAVQHWLTGFYNRDGVFTARYVLHSTFCPHIVFMCSVWIWEHTAIISLYSIDWLIFITETECVYCAVRSTFYVVPTQCIYVFCVDLRTNSDYSTVQHWLTGFYNWDGVCLPRGSSTFYVLPTQCIYVFCVDQRTNSDYFTVQHWLTGFYNWDGVCLLRGTFYILRSGHTLYLCVLCGSENKQRLFRCTALTDRFL